MTSLEDFAALGRAEQGLTVISTLRADRTMLSSLVKRLTAVFVKPERIYSN